jgi:hypothetical protein
VVRYTFTVRLLHSLHPARFGAFGTGLALRHVTPEWVLHSNFGCCIGTIKKSASYKISGAVERREVPICELVENKEPRLKEKKARAAHLAIPTKVKTFPSLSPPSRVKPADRLPMVALDCGFRCGSVPAMRG